MTKEIYKQEIYRLTEEGKEYLEKGLPEKNLLEILRKKPVSTDEAKEIVKHFDIAFQWLKKKDSIEIKNNFLHLVKQPELPEQDGLKKISLGEKVDEKVLQTLVERKLVEKVQIEVEELKKKIEGKEVTNLTPSLIKTGLWKNVKLVPYDINIPVTKIQQGKIQPYRQVIDEIRERLIGLGFVEARGPLVELNFWNCDALFIPSDHPARGLHDIFSIKNPKFGGVKDKELWERVGATHEKGWITGSKGWRMWDFSLARRLILRSHCTTVSSRTLAKLKKEDLPHKMFIIDRVFRPDVIDAKHFIEFENCEGIVVGEGVTLRHLLGYLKEIALAVTGGEKVMFRPHYFPYTEPSVEGYVYHSELGWVEFGGAGIFRPEVTLPLGIEVPVLAWGLGMGRLAMIKLKVNDIRYLYSDNLEWLRNKSIIR